MEQTIRAHYINSQCRLFFFDYDGTLVGFKPTPSEAKPTEEMLGILSALVTDQQNKVVVISGRDHRTLQNWFGDIPISLVAEHGFFVREKKSDSWQAASTLDESWKASIIPVLKEAVSSMPGAFIEEKVSSLVLHYRNVPEMISEVRVAEVQKRLNPHVVRLGLTLVPGNKIVEVRMSGFDKGMAADHWLHTRAWDFIFAAGDDTTDEDLFRVLPPASFSVKIGAGDSVAHYRLGTPEALLHLLKSLVQPDDSNTKAA